MGFWTKSLLIFNAFCHNTKQSIRQVAHQTGISKSSVHRLKQAMERRDTQRSASFSVVCTWRRRWAVRPAPCEG